MSQLAPALDPDPCGAAHPRRHRRFTNRRWPLLACPQRISVAGSHIMLEVDAPDRNPA